MTTGTLIGLALGVGGSVAILAALAWLGDAKKREGCIK